MPTFTKLLALAACVLATATAQATTAAQPGFLTHDSDAVLPNSPWKEQGMPDAGMFNPAGGDDEGPAAYSPAAAPAPAAMTYPPAIVIDTRQPKPYALVASPTLPCAPGYCPRLRPRADRH